jgi:hypothetical protein
MEAVKSSSLFLKWIYINPIHRNERAISPADSVLSVTSHLPRPQQPHISSSRFGATHSLSRAANTSGASKRSKPRHQEPLPFEDASHDNSRNRDIYNAPPTSSSAHPSLAYGGTSNGAHGAYDMAGGLSNSAGDWTAGHPPAGQLEGPGMPVARGSSHPVLAMASSAAMNASNLNSGDVKTAVTAVDGGTAEGGEAECDGDDTKYCVCDSVSYGEMIACDELDCEKEWVCVSIIFLMIDHQIDLILDSSISRVLGLRCHRRVDGSVICAKQNVAQKGEVVAGNGGRVGEQAGRPPTALEFVFTNNIFNAYSFSDIPLLTQPSIITDVPNEETVTPFMKRTLMV